MPDNLTIVLLVLVNSLLTMGFAVAFFFFFPRISRAQVHRGTTEMHMDAATRMMDPEVTQTLAEGADKEAEVDLKPLGVSDADWQAALELCALENCTVDEALKAIQAAHLEGDDVGPRGVGP